MKTALVPLAQGCEELEAVTIMDILVRGGVTVVQDGNIITSQGPAAAMAFALTLVENLQGKEKRDEVAQGLLFQLQ